MFASMNVVGQSSYKVNRLTHVLRTVGELQKIDTATLASQQLSERGQTSGLKSPKSGLIHHYTLNLNSAVCSYKVTFSLACNNQKTVIASVHREHMGAWKHVKLLRDGVDVNVKILENLAAHVAPALRGSRTTKDQSSATPSANSCRSQDLRVTVSSVHVE